MHKNRIKIQFALIIALLVSTQTVNKAQGDLDDGMNITVGMAKLKELAAELQDLENARQFIKNSVEYYETIKLMETAICSYQDLEFYSDKMKLVGYSNCFMDFEISASIIQIKNAGWVVTSAMKLWEKTSGSERAKNIKDGLNDFVKAQKDLKKVVDDLKRGWKIATTEKKRVTAASKNVTDAIRFYSFIY